MNISYTGCLGLFPAISLQFTPEICITAWFCKKIH